MSSTLFENKQCVLCNKTGGILTCDGCKQTFCGKHVVEHRQQLALQLENIMQEHDCIQQDIIVHRNDNYLFEQIDKWEKESITKIQIAAENARTDLRQTLQSSDERLTRACRDIATKLRSAREAENFSEIDLTRWTQQLNELKLQIKSQAMIYIPEDSSSGIHFIRIKQGNYANALIKNKDLSSVKASSSTRIRERFGEVNGLAIVEDGGLSIKHNDNDFRYIYSRGHQIYSEGRHTVKFRANKCAGSCNLFIGICSSSIGLRLIIYHLTIVAGWFSNNEVWQHGVRANNSTELHGYKNDDIKTNDVFELTLDCDKKQIELFRERTNKRHIINVDLDKTPFPWSILLALRRKGDCIQILPSN
jgi:hypothetical protein